jgi:superoxide reductase
MVEAHFIEWVLVQTDKGFQKKDLKAGDAPEVCFALCEDEKVEAVYAYCNLHGLWKKEA